MLAPECAHLLVEALSLVFCRYYALNILLNLGIALFQVFLQTSDAVLGELVFLLEPGNTPIAFFDMGLKILSTLTYMVKFIVQLSKNKMRNQLVDDVRDIPRHVLFQELPYTSKLLEARHRGPRTSFRFRPTLVP